MLINFKNKLIYINKMNNKNNNNKFKKIKVILDFNQIKKANNNKIQ